MEVAEEDASGEGLRNGDALSVRASPLKTHVEA